MADVFVSYSRRDAGFVRGLTDAICERAGREVWLDIEGIRDGEVFPEAIKRAIEQSHTFLFVITPNAVNSAYCENEVEYARQMQKRILPVLREPVPDAELPAEIRDRNWIPFTEDAEFEQGMARLTTALDTDLEATKAHTHWLVKALEWDIEDRDNSFLLRGSELGTAEAWLAATPEHADPAPTPLQRQYLLASRSAAARRQRTLMIGSIAVAAVSIGLLIFALISRSQAISSRQAAVSERIGARAQALAAESQAQLPNDPEISVILGMRAVRTKATPQSKFALRAALDASPLERALPTVADPGSCATNSGLSAASRPERQQIVEVSCNGSLRLLDPTTGRILRQEHLAGELTSVAYSPNGTTLAVGTASGAMLLDPDTLAVTARSPTLVPSDEPVNDIAFSPNGRTLAADLSQTGVALLVVPGLHVRTILHVQGLNGTVVFSRDGRLLIVGGGDAAVHIFDLATRRLVHKIVAPQQSGQGSWPEVVALSPDGTQLAVGYPTMNYSYGDVTLYNTHGWRREYTVMSTDTGEVSSVAFSPDGTRLAVGLEDGTAGVWSLITRDRLESYAGMTSAVTAIHFLRGGRSALTVANDGVGRVWRASGSYRTFAAVPSNITSLALGGSRLAMLQVNRGRTYLRTFAQPAGAPLLTRYVGPANNADSLSPDGRLLVTTGTNTPGRPQVRPIRLWSVAQGKALRVLGQGVVTYSTFSADGSRVLLQEGSDLSSSPGYLVVENTSTGHAVQLQDPPACVLGQAQFAFSANDKFVAAAAFCGLAEVWNARTGKLIREVTQGGETSGVALNSDGSRLLVSSWDSRATIWNVATGRPLVQLVGHTSGIVTAALSPDGSLVATAGLDDTVRLWNAHTGQELRLLSFAHWQVFIAFSPTGAQIAVAQYAPQQGAVDYVRVYDACPYCSDARGLLALARPLNIPPSGLTSLENTVIGRS
jgi:WD40 repeat protein